MMTSHSDTEIKSIDFESLFIVFREENFKGTSKQRMLIQAIENHLVNIVKINIERLQNINRKLVKRCIDDGKKTYKYFIEITLKWAECVNVQLDIEDLKKQAIQQINEWGKLLKDMERCKCKTR